MIVLELNKCDHGRKKHGYDRTDRGDEVQGKGQYGPGFRVFQTKRAENRVADGCSLSG